jgi:DNA-binding NtrC family response regulator
MSQALPVGTVENLDRGGQHQQPPSGTAAIGLASISISESPTLRSALAETEVLVIRRALQHTGWNRKRAAALLKISYRGLLYKIRRHSLTQPVAGD